MEGLLPDLDVIRKDFPILERVLGGGQPLVYLDSANTSQKPQIVIDTMVDHLERHNANIARAMHQLGAESTEAFEAARDKVAAFLNAPSRNEVIFTKNATEALNLLARTIDLGPGDNVVITEMEHHSNIVSWQLACERSGAELRWFGLTDDGRLDLSDIDSLITERTKVVSFTWVSNMLGTINPVAELTRRAHEVGAIVVVVLGAAFFCCLSITVAGLALSRDRMMGIGQAITMPLFFASNALYPVALMPHWLQIPFACSARVRAPASAN